MSSLRIDRRSFLGNLTAAALSVSPMGVPFFPPKTERLCGIDFDVLPYV